MVKNPVSRTLSLENSLEKLERIRESGQGQPVEPHPPLNQAQPPRLADKLPEPQDRVQRMAALGPQRRRVLLGYNGLILQSKADKKAVLSPNCCVCVTQLHHRLKVSFFEVSLTQCFTRLYYSLFDILGMLDFHHPKKVGRDGIGLRE